MIAWIKPVQAPVPLKPATGIQPVQAPAPLQPETGIQPSQPRQPVQPAGDPQAATSVGGMFQPQLGIQPIPVGNQLHPNDPIAKNPALLDPLQQAPATTTAVGPVQFGGGMTYTRDPELGQDPNPEGRTPGMRNEDRTAIEKQQAAQLGKLAQPTPIAVGDGSGSRIGPQSNRNPDGSSMGQIDTLEPHPGQGSQHGPPATTVGDVGQSFDPISIGGDEATLGDPHAGAAVPGDVPATIGGVVIPDYIRAQGLQAAQIYAQTHGGSSAAPKNPAPGTSGVGGVAPLTPSSSSSLVALLVAAVIAILVLRK